MYSDSVSWITLLPHKHVTQRQDPHMGKCLDIQFYDIFLMGNNNCFSDSCYEGGYGSTRPINWILSLSLAKLLHVFCLDSLVVATSVHFGSTTKQYGREWWQHMSLFAEDKQRSVDRAGWSERLANLRASQWHFYLS